MATIEYRNKRFRIIVAILASIYILLHGHDLSSVKNAFVSPSFYLALAVSFPITFFLVYYIHRVTVKLDAKHSWKEHFLERLTWQFLFAVFLPALFDVALISIHSAIIGEAFNWTEFILYDFPFIVALIVCLNMYYAIYYFMIELKRQKERVEDSPDEPILVIDYDRVNAKLNVRSDILFLYKKGNLIKIATRNREYSIRGSLSKFESDYSDIAFCRINRGTIVNMRTVEGFANGSKPRTLEVLFNIEVNKTEYEEDTFTVKDMYIPAFKEAMEKK